MHPTEMVRNVVRPIVAAVAMAAALIAFHHWSHIGVPLSAAAELSFKIVLGALVYASALILLWLAIGRPPGAERWLLNQVENFALRRKKVK